MQRIKPLVMLFVEWACGWLKPRAVLCTPHRASPACVQLRTLYQRVPVRGVLTALLLCLLCLGMATGGEAQNTGFETSDGWGAAVSTTPQPSWVLTLAATNPTHFAGTQGLALPISSSSIGTGIYAVNDAYSGNLTQKGYFQLTASGTEALLMARWSANTFTTGQGYFLDVQDSMAVGTPGVAFQKRTGGSNGSLTTGGARMASTAFLTGRWYYYEFTLSGSSLSAQFQDTTTGNWLQSGGTFTNAGKPGTAPLTGTDTTYSGAGYNGVGGYGLANCAVFDNFSVSAFTVASFTASPSSVVAGSTTSVTLTGVGTAWTSATTFAATNGTISNLSVNAGAQTATFTLTSTGSAGNSIALADSTDTATTSLSVTAPAGVTLSITDAAIYRSALWFVDGGAIQTCNPGNYVKIPLVLTTAGPVTISIAVSKMSGQNATEYPSVRLRVDTASGTDTQLTSGTTGVTTSSLSTGNHLIYLVMLNTGSSYSTNPDGYTYGAAEYGLRLTSLTAPTSTTFGVYTPRPKRLRVVGDSVIRLAQNPSGLNDAEASYAFSLANSLNAELDLQAWAGQGVNLAGVYGVPAWSTAWQQIDSTHSALSGGKFIGNPDFVYIQHGHNGTFTAGDVATMVNNVRGAVGALSPIFWQVAISRANVSALSAYFAGAPDAHTTLVDLGPQAQADIANNAYYTPDFVHPYAFYHAYLAGQALKTVGPSVNTSVSGAKRKVQ